MSAGTANEETRYTYEPDERPKKKHRWNADYAGFEQVEAGGGRTMYVGKCPANLSMEIAQELLNGGIPYFSRRARGVHPDRIYAVYNGVIYRAVPTRLGVSYHGFPEPRRDFDPLPKKIRDAVLARAQELGQEEAVSEWLSRSVEELGR